MFICHKILGHGHWQTLLAFPGLGKCKEAFTAFFLGDLNEAPQVFTKQVIYYSFCISQYIFEVKIMVNSPTM